MSEQQAVEEPIVAQGDGASEDNLESSSDNAPSGTSTKDTGADADSVSVASVDY